MSIASEIITALPEEVLTVNVVDTVHHGEKAVEVNVRLVNSNKIVTGVFTKHEKAAFGGVEFSQRKNVPALMVSKIKSVLIGTAE